MGDQPTIDSQPRTSPAMVPYLAVQDARSAIEWYVDVLGAAVSYPPIIMPDGRVGHSELTIGDATIYLSDAHPELGVVAPTPGASSVSLVLAVSDADAVLARVEEAGGSRDHGREPADSPDGERRAWMLDPFGHRWLLHSPLP